MKGSARSTREGEIADKKGKVSEEIRKGKRRRRYVGIIGSEARREGVRAKSTFHVLTS